MNRKERVKWGEIFEFTNELQRQLDDWKNWRKSAPIMPINKVPEAWKRWYQKCPDFKE